MQTSTGQNATKRRPVNLTIRADILDEAKALKLNASQAAETGIIRAIKEARGREWLAANKAAITAHNERVEKRGTLLRPGWSSE